MKLIQNRFRTFVFIIIFLCISFLVNTDSIRFAFDTSSFADIQEEYSDYNRKPENESQKSSSSVVSVKYMTENITYDKDSTESISETDVSVNENSEIVSKSISSDYVSVESMSEDDVPDYLSVESEPENELYYYKSDNIELSYDSTRYIIDIPFISQNSLYPTGCESVSAVMALNYMGYDITVDEFIECYLDMTGIPYKNNGVTVGESPWDYFIGYPYSDKGYGCYSTVIENALCKFMYNDTNSVNRLSGVDMESLCEDYVKNDIPVIIWATLDMTSAYEAETWIMPDGEYLTWIAPEHCLLLVGFDDEYYYFNDPRRGKNIPYIKSEVETAYNSLYCQAVVIS